MVYESEHYNIAFSTPSRRSQSSAPDSVNQVGIEWITPDDYKRRQRSRKAWEDRLASIGTRTAQTIVWLKAIVKLSAVPTSKDLSAIFGSEGEVSKGIWKLRSSPEDQNVFPVGPDFSVSYLPHGSDTCAAQLIVYPGMYSHRVTLQDIEVAFGKGTVLDGTALTPRETGTVHLSYQLPHGSMSVVRHDYQRDQSVSSISFWWKPANSACSTLEESTSRRAALGCE